MTRQTTPLAGTAPRADVASVVQLLAAWAASSTRDTRVRDRLETALASTGHRSKG